MAELAVDFEAEITADLADQAVAATPLGYVMWAFEWGSGELEGYEGPEPWQREVLGDLGDGTISISEATQIAVASGHGIGKSALVSWIILWAMSTMTDTMGVVTANTDTQLKTKTQPQLVKWHRLARNAHWFRVTATAIFSTDPRHERTWRFDFVPWSESNTEAFAGLHNSGKRVVVVFDEASAIPAVIWEVAEGALTDKDTEIIWLACGNPTQNTGRFKECFNRFRHRWQLRQVDSREVSLTNKSQIAQWAEDYGEDSDFFRVRVRGVFPRVGDQQFISTEIVETAMARPEPMFDSAAPIIIGVDPARFGDDQSVIYTRIGRDGKGFPAIKLRGVDTVELANRAAAWAMECRADAIIVDGGGVGGGVVDYLRRIQTGGAEVYEVNFGARANSASLADTAAKGERYANKAAEMWGAMRAWLKAGGVLPDDPELAEELTGRNYSYRGDLEIQLEKKSDMKRRGLASPDIADALAVTFAFPVAKTGTLDGRPNIITDHVDYLEEVD